MRQLRAFLFHQGVLGFLRLLFYPLTLVITTPIRLLQTLWHCRYLAAWRHAPQFSPLTAVTNLFYWRAAQNLRRFGRTGTTPYMALGNYKLSSLFHYTLPSLYLYERLGALLPFLGMFCWWLLHLLWLEQTNPPWLILIMTLTLISTSFYVNIFRLQNYNVLGWLFVPLGLWGMVTGRWWLAVGVWLAASFGSLTVVVMMGFLALLLALGLWSLAPIFVMIPTGLKLLTHLWPLIKEGGAGAAVANILKAIGSSRANVKYQRTLSAEAKIKYLYYLILYLQFFLAAVWFTLQFPWLLLGGLILIALNATFVRFADDQSTQMLALSLGTLTMLQHEIDWLLPFYWLLISPLPYLLIGRKSQSLDVMPVYGNFSLVPLLDHMRSFLNPVSSNQRVLLAFDDPQGQYHNLFNGYRSLIELPAFVASSQQIHFMPDWWGVFALNYEGAADFWGRDVAAVQANLEKWQVDFVIIFQEQGTALDPTWQAAGFRPLGKFSWGDYALGDEPLFIGATPDWWLLQKPQESS